LGAGEATVGLGAGREYDFAYESACRMLSSSQPAAA
jgi:hypothetical protein